MNKRNHDIQVEKDLKTIHRIGVFGCILVFIGFTLLTGFSQSREVGEEVPNWAVILTIAQIGIGFIMANLLTILKIIFNPKEKAKFKKKVREEAERCHQDFDDNIEIFAILFTGALMCLAIVLFL